ncbi:MAG TPA: AI-2E family transporter [Blastocatellia bacterium]|nr:AI-2E family transporter [Blastocatellia bacterium]
MKKKVVDQPALVRAWTIIFVRVLFIIVSLAIVVWVIYKLSTLLLLLVLSIFFCYLIAPLVRLVEQPIYLGRREMKLPRTVAICVVYAAAGFVLFLAIQWIVPILWPQVQELAKQVPGYIKSGSETVNKTINDADSWMRRLKLPQEWRQYMGTQAEHLAGWLGVQLTDLGGSALGYLPYLTWLILVPILSFFMLKDAARFERAFVTLMPNERLRKRVHWLLLDVNRTLAAYVRAQVTSCVVIGSVVTIAYTILGVPYAIVLGLIAAVLEFFPMIGPLLASAISVGLTLTVSLKLAIIVAAFLIVLRIVQDYILYPKIVGQGIKMHPLVVVLAILAGAEIGGLSGIFLAIPFVGLIIVVYNHYLAYRGIENLRAAPQQSEEVAELPASGSAQPVLEKQET